MIIFSNDSQMKLDMVHSGQVALIMVLIMTVVSAIVISMASRSTVETRVQQTSSENTDALLAASSGLEKAVVAGSALSGTIAEGKSYSVTFNIEGTTGVFFEKVNSGETIEINLQGSSALLSGVKIYWTPIPIASLPSIFVSEIRNDRIYDYGFNSSGINGFSQIVSGGILNGLNFNFVSPQINVSPTFSKTLLVTVLGGSAIVGVGPVGGLFPAQVNSYRSVGNVNTGSSEIKYGIEYKESVTNQIPSVFDFALFSNGSIIQ